MSTFPLPTFALVTRWRGGLGLAGVYSGEYVDRSCCTICSAATCATRAPSDDIPARFVMTFLGERTPVVGRVGLRMQERTRALDTGPWTELSTEQGDKWSRGEAGWPPHRPAGLGLAPLASRRQWREGGDLHRFQYPDATRRCTGLVGLGGCPRSGCVYGFGFWCLRGRLRGHVGDLGEKDETRKEI